MDSVFGDAVHILDMKFTHYSSAGIKLASYLPQNHYDANDNKCLVENLMCCECYLNFCALFLQCCRPFTLNILSAVCWRVHYNRNIGWIQSFREVSHLRLSLALWISRWMQAMHSGRRSGTAWISRHKQFSPAKNNVHKLSIAMQHGDGKSIKMPSIQLTKPAILGHLSYEICGTPNFRSQTVDFLKLRVTNNCRPSVDF